MLDYPKGFCAVSASKVNRVGVLGKVTRVPRPPNLSVVRLTRDSARNDERFAESVA